MTISSETLFLTMCRMTDMELIESVKQRTLSSMEMFLRNFSKVPDDKLTWQATPTAKSALRIGAHTALYASRFARMIKSRTLPAPENLADWLARIEKEERAVTSRKEVEKILREGTAEVLQALDSLKPEDLDSSIDSGQGWSMTMLQVIGLPAFHATVHCGQIDFLQTCWDDQEVYVG